MEVIFELVRRSFLTPIPLHLPETPWFNCRGLLSVGLFVHAIQPGDNA
jgi:hypothetical protein